MVSIKYTCISECFFFFFFPSSQFLFGWEAYWWDRSTMEPVSGRELMVASLWGMRCVDDFDFFLYFPYPYWSMYFPYFLPPQYLPYPFMSRISQNFLLISTSLVLYSTWDNLSVTHMGIGHHLLFDVPDLSSGLSFEQVVGFNLVHSLLSFLGCENWVRLN